MQPSISDYGYIGDCHSAALISKHGSIDWCCMPRIDYASCFGRLLDWEKGGFCQIIPTGEYQSSRRYLPNSMVLETRFQTSDSEVRLLDFFPMREGGEHHPHQQIIRLVEWVRGSMELNLQLQPRFDYGAIKPWIRSYIGDTFIALGGRDGLLISTNFPLVLHKRHQLTGTFIVNCEQCDCWVSIIYAKPEDLDENLIQPPKDTEIKLRLDETLNWWIKWLKQGHFKSRYAHLASRSAMVLKCLSNAPTGAIAAAATTSLPETPAGCRNWDYRYSWVRDSCFSVRALAVLGFVNEANGFRKFIERSCAGSANQLQILFGVDGRRHIFEHTLDYLSGYQNAKPVRIGNAAHTQIQHDVYGELLSLAWNWHERGASPDEDYWLFLEETVEAALKIWEKPDQGIWELRGEPRHFVFSKVMCWVALDCGIRLAEDLNKPVDLKKWQAGRDLIRQTIEEQGYDKNRGVYIQAFGFPHLDSSLLLLPFFGYVPHDDERMVRTADAIRQELEIDGLLLRYPRGSDEMDGKEGTFLACTFWLVACLARQGRRELAQQIFENAITTGNDLDLFSEEYLPESKAMLGNFPQALTHLSIIAAIIMLNE